MIWVVAAFAGVTPARSTTEALNAALGPRRIAVLIGVDTYEDPTFPALRHAGSDADMLAGVLRDPSMGGFDDVVALSASPTREQVLAALRQATRDLRAEDVLLVYFSGHGTRVRAGEAWRRYLLERDSRAMALDTSALELEALQTWFSGLPSARKVLIVDACFDGDGKSVVRPADRGVSGGGLTVPSAASLGSGEAYLFATTPGRAALEDDQLGHGLYTYYLIEALSWSFADADRDQDGVVTAWEAHDHARTQVIAWSGGAQVPEAAFRVVGTADLVLSGAAAARKRRDQSLVYLYAPESHPLTGGTVTIDGLPRGTLPGTVPVPPGRHHVEIADVHGERVADGFLKLEAGRPYRAEDLARLIRGPSSGLAARAVAVAAPGFGPASGAVGVEGVRYWRDAVAPGRGFTVAARAAVLGSERAGDLRPGMDVGVELGIQHDYRRLRGAVGGTVGAVWWPRDAVPGADPQPGWVFATFGPSLSASAVLSEGVSVGAFTRPLLTVLDLDGDGAAEPIPWVGAGLQISAVLK